ncbi:MAG: 1-acyl-sn-glycerol-3-phosphate acyltransferase [Anaerolineae bacterium]|nr:1-acyl-sn-glycerol-3-phosphate acyltransferase [Anaerolineae bacterium]
MKPRRYWAWRIAHWLMRIITNLILKLDTSGVGRIPPTGPVALIGNHTNFIDPVLAYTVHDRYVKGMTASETYHRFLFNILAWAVDAIPVDRGTPDREAIRACIEALHNGWALYIAPEGTRSGHGRLQEGKAGVTFILLQAGTQIPIYPIAFIGLWDFWPNIKRLRRTPTRVVMGKPFYLAPPPGRVRAQVRDQITTEMMGQIAALMPPDHRGLYADQVGVAPQYLRFAPPNAAEG